MSIDIPIDTNFISILDWADDEQGWVGEVIAGGCVGGGDSRVQIGLINDRRSTTFFFY